MKNNEQRDQTAHNPIYDMQTSASSSTAPTSLIHGTNFEAILDYLCPTNDTFSKHMHIILPPASNLEVFREMAILMHHIMNTSIVYALWLVYRRSGTGELPSPISAYRGDRRVWPAEVKSLAKRCVVDSSFDDNEAYQRVVERYLHDLKVHSQHYQRELQIKIQSVPAYTRIIEYTLERFVKQGLQSLHIDIDRQIASIQYQYIDEILQRAFITESPNDKQRERFELLCKLKRDQEMTKHGVLLLKEKGSEASGVHPFDVAMVPPLLIRIQDSLLREALCKEYKKVTKQARNTMMALYLECAEKQQRQYQIDYDATVKEMVPSGQKFSRSMNHLLHKRLENINACIACEYKFQIALVRLKSQTR